MDATGWMQRAIALAEQGRYGAPPNPVVGCVLVRDEAVVGEGYHARAGAPHAEAEALAAAGPRARGATAYLTLEPCAHHGRTPPCADALAAAGVARVVVAGEDPNPQVAGQGLARLRAVGIAVEVGLLRAEAEALNPGFLKRMRSGCPYVRVKMALSLDGRSAPPGGAREWISGAAARTEVQHWRARSCAIVTGIGTVLADDPLLTARLPGLQRTPLRVVVDSHLRCPPQARLLSAPGPVLIATTAALGNAAALAARGAEVLRLPAGPGGVDLEALWAALAARACNEVLIEAGATLAGRVLAAGLADELVLYVAPHLLGDDAYPAFRLPAPAGMTSRRDFELLEVGRVGEDIRIRARPKV